jgi:hypothetical protein
VIAQLLLQYGDRPCQSREGVQGVRQQVSWAALGGEELRGVELGKGEELRGWSCAGARGQLTCPPSTSLDRESGVICFRVCLLHSVTREDARA